MKTRLLTLKEQRPFTLFTERIKTIQPIVLSLLLLIPCSIQAQTMNVQVGQVTYQFPATQAGAMTYSNGTTLTIMGKTFTLSEIDNMYVDETAVTDNLVSIVYGSSSASITVAGNVAQYVTPSLNGTHVTIAQSNTDAVSGDEITYQLSGSTSNGSLTLGGSYKCTVSLAGVTLTNPSGAAINITNSKRIQLSAKNGTTNTLTDGASGSQKACIYSKGQLQLQGKGTLNVVGNTKHAIKSASYISIKNMTLNITSAVGDGISCEEYMEIKSGTVSISGVGDDGIQCDLGGTTSTGVTTDHEDEDTGNVYISGGTITISVTAAAAKGIKADGEIIITGGSVNATTSGGGAWDSDDLKTKASAGLSADGNIAISGGTLVLISTGAGGKGISGDGTLVVSDSTSITVTTSGQAVVASSSGTISVVSNSNSLDRYGTNYKSSPKGIKIDGAITVTGGAITVTTSGAGGEGMETKSTMTISGGQVTVNSYDDCLNATSHLTISGGYVYANASNNDGIDANGNCYIQGGLVYAIGASSPEVAIDANTEGGYKLYVTGGTIIAVGGLESGTSISGGTAKQASSWTANNWYALYNGSTLVAAFKTPSSSSSSSGGGGRKTLVVYTSSTPALKAGVTVSGGSSCFGGIANVGGTVSGGTTVTLSNYSNSRW
ncbi:MAG: carbohydrate-binding domain-containing protein [Paludibacteraceae bacterium]|nr:carbohydrate-binding domain-containing protein [Paludibacteraceae bacterium]